MIKVPLSWLRDYINITQTPEELAAGLTLRGLEVGAIHTPGSQWERIVVGQVLAIEKHPNADRLVVLLVTDSRISYQVVTGAMNLKVGDKIPLALAGAKLIDGHKLIDEQAAGKRTAPLLAGDLPYFTVKPGKMRGVDSQAVAVAALELGVSEDFGGIVVLDDEAPVGDSLMEVLGDTIIELELSPNLGRALSMIGVAREVSAMTGQLVHQPEISVHENGPDVNSLITVRNEAPDLCPRFSMMVIEGVTIAPSPEWMQRRLNLAGIRPINNVVDITNYVMLELGQPLHAYDYDDIRGHELIVRRAKPGEKVETIDHKDHELTPEIVINADAERGIGLAGVMGGVDSEVKDTTRNVALEGANWNPANIRQTSRGLFATASEAAKRFERYVDIELTVQGVMRGIQLMQELAGGTVAEGIIDIYPSPVSPRVIELPLNEVPRLLGVTIPKPAVVRMLEALEFDVAELRPDGSYQFRDDESQYTIVVSEIQATPDVLMVRVPTYRNDVTIKADLIEEIARMYGYDKIPERRLRGELSPQAPNEQWLFEDKLRDILTATGLNEVITYTLVSLESLKNLHAALPPKADGAVQPTGPHLHHLNWSDPAHLLKLANPLTVDREYMRPTLLSSLLEVVGENRRFMDRVAVFEIGRAYLVRPDEKLPEERPIVSLAITGPRNVLSRYNPKAGSAEDQLDFFDLKGIVETLLNRINTSETVIEYQPVAAGDAPTLHPGRAALIWAVSKVKKGETASRTYLGMLGELHPKVAEAFGLNPAERIGIAELNVAALIPLMARERYKTVTRLPVVTQDLAIVVPDETPAGQVRTLITETGGALLTEVTLFDIYRGKPIPEGKKSLAFRLTFYPQDKTLTEEEVSKIRQRIEGRLVRELGAETRG